jgi:hypothetical protein
MKYDTICRFVEGMAIVGAGGSYSINRYGRVYDHRYYGFIDSVGNEVIPPTLHFAFSYSEGLTYQYYGDGGSVWYDKRGRVAVRYREGQGDNFYGGIARVNKRAVGMHRQLGDSEANPHDLRDNYINRAGEVLIPTYYDTIAAYRPGLPRLVAKAGRYGILDGRGSLAVPLRYDDARAPVDSLVWVRQADRWGRIDGYGRTVVPFRFDAARPTAAGHAIVRMGDSWGLVDRLGVPLTAMVYDNLGREAGGRILMQRDGLYGFLDESGEVRVAARFRRAWPYARGSARVQTLWLDGTIDPAGEWLSRWPRADWLYAIGILAVLGYWLRQKQGYLARLVRRQADEQMRE